MPIRMDQKVYGQYKQVLENGTISLNGLGRIIGHDKSSGWEKTTDGLARIQVYEDGKSGKIKVKKVDCVPGDSLYNVAWHLPLTFDRPCSHCNH